MRYRVLVLGGYGTFGTRITRELAKDKAIHVIIGGRDRVRGEGLARSIRRDTPESEVQAVTCDIDDLSFPQELRALRANAVVNTCGPFQHRDYRVAEACIRTGIHYIDLADARDYVTGFTKLDALAQQQAVVAITGASTVPALAAAVIDELIIGLTPLSIDYGINPGNQTPRGLATVRAILSYCGKPFLQWRNGQWIEVHGWQGLRRHRYPAPMGKRWLGYCNVPDLSLFPQRYPSVRDVVFRAGLELSLLHLGTWALSWLGRWGIVGDWSRYAPALLRASEWFLRAGSHVGGMHVTVTGMDAKQRLVRRTWYLVAENGDGPQVPCTPSVVLIKKLARGELVQRGAMPAVGLATLTEFVAALEAYSMGIHTVEEKLGKLVIPAKAGIQ